MSKRIVVLISGRGSNLKAILEAQDRLAGSVVGVLTNNPDAPGLQYADLHGVPALVVNHREFSGRQAFDGALRDAVDGFEPDLVVLAGFMRILSRTFVEHYAGRLLNTHPSLLPLFPGLHAVRQALEAKVAETGCTVHMVTAEVDAGPIIAQRRVPVRLDDTVEQLEARVLEMEHQLLPETIARFCRGELRSLGAI